MIGDSRNWQRFRQKDILNIENMLRNVENNYVGACWRFLERDAERDNIWTLYSKDKKIKAIIINSKSSLIPVLFGLKEIPEPKFLESLVKKKKLHSIQGIAGEVSILETAMERNKRKPRDAYDYDLMALDKLPAQDVKYPSGLVLRIPRLTDLDALAPLQAGYEREEVLPKGSVFSPAASRVNLANIVASGKILAAVLNGKLVGKINVNAHSFTRYMVGGVYVHPDFRGMGIARAMTSAFIASLINEGMGITLFVKKANLAARKLYLGLGFTIMGDYRITYF